MIEIRALLEGYGVEQIAGELSVKEINELKKMIEDCEYSVNNDEKEAFVEHDYNFHDYLIARFANPWIKKVMVSIEDFTIRERNLAKESVENIKASLNEHRGIVEALSVGDKTRAGDLMRDHWCAIHDRYMNNSAEIR